MTSRISTSTLTSATWMAIGAATFSVLQYCLPGSQGASLSVYLFFGSLFVKTIIDERRRRKGSLTSLRRGRWTAILGNTRRADGMNNGADGIVMFALGSRLNQYV